MCFHLTRGTPGAYRLVSHYCAAMGVFTRHQWAPFPAHKGKRARGCAQCESPLRGTAVLLCVLAASCGVNYEEVGEQLSARVSAHRPHTANSRIVELYS